MNEIVMFFQGPNPITHLSCQYMLINALSLIAISELHYQKFEINGILSVLINNLFHS